MDKERNKTDRGQAQGFSKGFYQNDDVGDYGEKQNKHGGEDELRGIKKRMPKKRKNIGQQGANGKRQIRFSRDMP